MNHLHVSIFRCYWTIAKPTDVAEPPSILRSELSSTLLSIDCRSRALIEGCIVGAFHCLCCSPERPVDYSDIMITHLLISTNNTRRARREHRWKQLAPTVLWSILIFVLTPSLRGFSLSGVSVGNRIGLARGMSFPRSDIRREVVASPEACSGAEVARRSPLAAESWLRRRFRTERRRIKMQVLIPRYRYEAQLLVWLSWKKSLHAMPAAHFHYLRVHWALSFELMWVIACFWPQGRRTMAQSHPTSMGHSNGICMTCVDFLR